MLYFQDIHSLMKIYFKLPLHPIIFNNQSMFNLKGKNAFYKGAFKAYEFSHSFLNDTLFGLPYLAPTY